MKKDTTYRRDYYYTSKRPLQMSIPAPIIHHFLNMPDIEIEHNQRFDRSDKSNKLALQVGDSISKDLVKIICEKRGLTKEEATRAVMIALFSYSNYLSGGSKSWVKEGSNRTPTCKGFLTFLRREHSFRYFRCKPRIKARAMNRSLFPYLLVAKTQASTGISVHLRGIKTRPPKNLKPYKGIVRSYEHYITGGYLFVCDLFKEGKFYG